MILQIVFYSFLVMLASLAGVISIWGVIGKIIEKNLHFLVSFSAGVFIFVSYQLSCETIEHAKSIRIGLLWVLIGIFSVWLIFKLLPFFHHHHDRRDVIDDHIHSRLDIRRIILGDAIHNIGDGLLIATSFLVSQSLGLTASLSIFIHEVIQEISEFFVLRESGYNTTKALSINFAVSFTILIGAIGGFFLLKQFEMIEIPLLGFSSGSFLMVVIQDLIPHSIKSSTTKVHIAKHLIWFAIGVLLMSWLNITFTH